MHEHIKHMIKHNPHRAIEIIEEMVEDYGEDILEYFNSHIKTDALYQQYVSVFKNFDGTKGAHWSVDAIQQKANIDFSTKEYTNYDYAYVVNMKYSDDGDLMPVENLFKSAQRYLEDVDYYGNPSERAYCDGKKRYEYFTK